MTDLSNWDNWGNYPTKHLHHHYKRNAFHHHKFAKSSMALVLAVLAFALAVSIKLQGA